MVSRSVVAPPILLVALALMGAAPRTDTLAGPAQPAPTVTAQKYPGAAVVLLEDVGELRFEDDRDPAAGHTFSTRMRLKILSPSGRGSARVSVGLSGRTSLVRVAARSYGADGKVTDLLPDSIAYQAHLDPMVAVYSDARSAVFDVPSADVGDILEYEVSTRTVGTPEVPRWFFQGDNPSLESRFTVDMADDWSVHHGVFLDGVLTTDAPSCTKADDRQRCTWVARDQPALRGEDRGLSVGGRARRLDFSVGSPHAQSVARWEDVGVWYRGLVATLPELSLPARVAIEAQAARLPGETPEERLFRWVRDQVRYVAVHRNIGAFKPHAPDEVRARSWGDCKDMTTLLVALLRGQGVAAHPALISAGTYFAPESPPAIGAFDHAIVAVEDGAGGWRFLDPTDKETAYGVVGMHLRGRRALVVRPSDVVDTVVPWGAGDDRWEVDWTVSATGAVQLHTRAYGGYARELAGWAGASRAARERYVRAFLSEGRAVAVRDIRVEQVGPREAHLRARLEVPAVYLEAGGLRFATLGVFWSSADEFRVSADRHTPVWLGVPRQVVERIVLASAPGREPTHRPPPVSWQSTALAVRTEVTDSPQGLVLTRTREVREPRLPVARAEELATYTRWVHQTAVESVVWAVQR